MKSANWFKWSVGITVLARRILLSDNQLWKNGPAWLKTSINAMPALPDEVPELCIAELKTKVVHNLLTTQAVSIGRPINIERFSTSHKLYRTTAYVLKFVRLLRREVASAELTLANLSEVERLWIIDAQSSMAQDQTFPKWKAQFSLFQDDHQIWRCGGHIPQNTLWFYQRSINCQPSSRTVLIDGYNTME